VRDFHLKKVQGVVDEGHKVAFLCNCECVVEEHREEVAPGPKDLTMFS